MDLFSKYGFEFKRPENQWYKDNLVIYDGLGQDINNNFVVELFTLCDVMDIALTDKIIFRGEYNEMINFLKSDHRDDQLNKLLK